MPVLKHKPTTSSPQGSTSQYSSPVGAEQEEFRQHVCRLAVSAVQVLLEQVMRKEPGQCLGDTFTTETHPLGRDAGYSLAQDSRRLIAEREKSRQTNNQPERLGREGGVFVRFSLCQLTRPRFAVCNEVGVLC